MFICSANLGSPECSPGIEATPSESVSKSCPEVHGGVDFRRGTSSSRKIGIVMGHKSERDSYGSGIFWWGNQLVRSSSPNGSFMVVDWPHFPWYPIKAQKKKDEHSHLLIDPFYVHLCLVYFSMFSPGISWWTHPIQVGVSPRRTRPTLLESGKKSEAKANKESGFFRATEPRPSHDRTTVVRSTLGFFESRGISIWICKLKDVGKMYNGGVFLNV